MFHVATPKLLNATLLVWISALAFAVPVHGAEPEPQRRAFMLVLPFDATFEDCPDVAADDSLFLITHPGKDHNPSDNVYTFDFSSCEDDPDLYVEKFNGTRWYIGGYVTHVTAGGAQTYLLYWQDEVPPPGAVAETGPEGSVVIEHYWIRPASFVECDGLGDYVAEDFPMASSKPICYGVGLFSH